MENTPTERDALARELVDAARSGTTVDLKNADGCMAPTSPCVKRR